MASMTKRDLQPDDPPQQHPKRVRTAGRKPLADATPTSGQAPRRSHLAGERSTQSKLDGARSSVPITTPLTSIGTGVVRDDAGSEASLIPRGRGRHDSDADAIKQDFDDGMVSSCTISDSPTRPGEQRRPSPAGSIPSIRRGSSEEDRPEKVYKAYWKNANKFFGTWLQAFKESGCSEGEFLRLTRGIVRELGSQKAGGGQSDTDGSQSDSAGDRGRLKAPRAPGAVLDESQPIQTLSSESTGVANGTSSPHLQPIAELNLAAGKQRQEKAAAPTTLVESLCSRMHNQAAGEETLEDDLDRLSAAKRIEAKDFGGRVSSREICILGTAILDDVFGHRGQKRLANLFFNLYSRRADQQLRRSLHSMGGPVADQIFRDGCVELSNFTKRWAHAVQNDFSGLSVVDDIRVLDAKVSVVKEWAEWSREGETNENVSVFLERNGIPRQKSICIASRIARYLGRRFNLQARQITKKIYAWKPYGILERQFGPGVFALIPKSLLTCYSKLRSTEGSKKEQKFQMVVESIAAELPMLRDICDACNTHVVQPVLAADGIQDSVNHVGKIDVAGIRMALDGEVKMLYQTSICELLSLTPGLPLPGSTEEVGVLDKDDREGRAESREYEEGTDEPWEGIRDTWEGEQVQDDVQYSEDEH